MSEHHEDLIEPEGVNAASVEGTEEGTRPPGGDVVSGGHPEDAPPLREADEARGEEMLGTAGTSPPDPSQAAGPPGQDSGSAQ